MTEINFLSKTEISTLIPKRKTDTNKGDFGHILIVGGDNNMAGAVVMATEAAYRSGEGRVTVFTREKHFSALISRLPSAMTASANYQKDLQKIIRGKTIIAIGCGLGQSAWSNKMFKFFMQSNLPKAY